MGIRMWLLRRVMGRLRITDDIIKHLATFQRLGEMAEVQMPGELLPVGARTVFRAVRTRAAAQLATGWLWPYWLDRQLDPTSPAFVPRGHLPVLTNVTARNWTAVGPLGSVHEAVVDPRGLVTPWFDGWSLDWWVATGGEWRFPSKEGSAIQRLLGHGPVVETALRATGGGEVVHRVYGADDAEPFAVVEVENGTAEPVGIALAVRPYNPEGLAVVERIALLDTTVLVDGRPAALLPRHPDGVAASIFRDGDSARRVAAGHLHPRLPEVHCDVGLAQAAFVYNLPPHGSLRAAVPLESEHRTRLRLLERRRVRRGGTKIGLLPSGSDVTATWNRAVQHGMRLRLPDGRLTDAIEANRRWLLLLHDGDEITPGPYTYHRFWFRDAAYMLAALDRYGLHTQAAQVIRHFPARQHADGFFFSQRQEWDANGAAIWAMAEHWRLTGDVDVVDPAAVVKGVRWIERQRHAKRRRRDPALQGLMPASISAEHLGPFDYYYWDDFWSLRGLLDGAALLRAVGCHAEAAEADAAAVAMRRDVCASLSLTRQRLASDVIPAGPRRGLDPGIIGALVACYPLRLFAAADTAIAATAEAVRERFLLGPAFFQGISHTGLGTYLTLQLALVELEAGDPRAVERLEWMADAATDTFTWPEAIHPRLGGGCMGDGHHGWAAADFLTMARNVLVREVGDDGLAICTFLPQEWRGQSIEVADAPTHHGLLSFSVQPTAARTRLAWRLVPHLAADHRPVRLTAPGLDSRWSTTEAEGDVQFDTEVGALPGPGRQPDAVRG